MIHFMTLQLDDDDDRAIQAAIAARQTVRDQQGCILPDGESDLAGALIAEICRGWLEMREARS